MAILLAAVMVSGTVAEPLSGTFTGAVPPVTAMPGGGAIEIGGTDLFIIVEIADKEIGFDSKGIDVFADNLIEIFFGPYHGHVPADREEYGFLLIFFS